ncbi:predicted protein [Postia placenta Mad-698-R]|uniref:Uncharacterized protein n=1 Tax=Postia placenta MAD-698-R-SB12 TaxID=670580 RepID=A0A1X6NA99_9APHY|nr:hypothetical protein POSPLADRAFT_1134279 [Postia placenta MAD-698-R-SB12]EED81302.1 predicted protein [Postia placenta Mad-698-R]OSX65577.1 hypothetical protein POSPLADRAFT_1134279 [Postia placenta MAD-698-R-SB12]
MHGHAIEHIPPPNRETATDVKALLKSTRAAVREVDSVKNISGRQKIGTFERIRSLEVELEKYRKKYRELKSQIKITRHSQEKERAEDKRLLAREQSQGQDSLRELHKKLESKKSELAVVQEKMERSEESIKKLDEEMKLWRTSSIRYKKKVGLILDILRGLALIWIKFYALKAGVKARNRGDSSDDSLEVI